uniref:Uncharacterized protein n=1 Tax=Strongyloides papillosus TaxID=174720 RepID=A0A0N5BB26_STREA
MRILLLLILPLIILGENVTEKDLNKCYTKSIEKIEHLFGNFLTKEQGLKIYSECMDMYFMNKTLVEIVLFQIPNQVKYLNSQQINTINSVIDKISTILGSTSEAVKLLTKVSYSLLDFISSDKKNIDMEIENNFKKDLPLITIKRETCRSLYKILTEDKKIQILDKIKSLTPSDKFDDCLKEVRMLIKL